MWRLMVGARQSADRNKHHSRLQSRTFCVRNVLLSMFPLEYRPFMKQPQHKGKQRQRLPSGRNSLLVTKDRFVDNSCGQKEAEKKQLHPQDEDFISDFV